jgi:hypothetical protein
MQFKDHITPQTADTVKLPYPLWDVYESRRTTDADQQSIARKSFLQVSPWQSDMVF